MKWVWGCKQEYVHLLVQARGVRFPTSRLLRMNGRTPCWECFAKKNCCQTSSATAQSAMLTLRTVSTRIWSERKDISVTALRTYLICQASRIQGWHVAGWPAECEHSKAKWEEATLQGQLLHIANLAACVHNPPFEQHFFTRLHPAPLWHFCRAHLQNTLSAPFKIRTPFRRIWRTVCRTPLAQHRKTLLNNTSAKSLRRLSLRLGSVNKFPTLYG